MAEINPSTRGTIMRIRTGVLWVVVLAVPMLAAGEEILLKDGTKISENCFRGR
jgi:hypothetical protein